MKGLTDEIKKKMEAGEIEEYADDDGDGVWRYVNGHPVFIKGGAEKAAKQKPIDPRDIDDRELTRRLAGILPEQKAEKAATKRQALPQNRTPSRMEKDIASHYSDETFSIDDKIIMRSGKWNGVEINNDDLDEMVRAFSEIKKDVPLKLGHDPKQAILQKDGYPAAGWVSSLKRTGDKLVASFRDIPRAVKDLIEKKAYNQVSIEMAMNYNDNGKKYPRFLKGVALLGADLPAVSGLESMLALYTDESQETVSINFTDLIKEEGQMDELKKLQDEVAAKDKVIADQQAQIKVFTDAAEKAAEDKKAADVETRKQEIKTFIDAQKKEGRVTPANEAMLQSIMESLDDAKTVKFADAAGKEQEVGVRKHFENFIATLQKVVDFSTKTEDGEKVEEFKAKTEEEGGSVNGQKLHYFACGLMKKNKEMAYADAYKQAKKEHPECVEPA